MLSFYDLFRNLLQKNRVTEKGDEWLSISGQKSGLNTSDNIIIFCTPELPFAYKISLNDFKINHSVGIIAQNALKSPKIIHFWHS